MDILQYKSTLSVMYKYYHVNLYATMHIIDLRPETSLVSVFSIVPNISVAQFKEYLITVQRENQQLFQVNKYQPEQSKLHTSGNDTCLKTKLKAEARPYLIRKLFN